LPLEAQCGWRNPDTVVVSYYGKLRVHGNYPPLKYQKTALTEELLPLRAQHGWRIEIQNKRGRCFLTALILTMFKL
jgi:hypothetical protein